MTITIKNIDTEVHAWAGKQFTVDEDYTTSGAEEDKRFLEDNTFISDLDAKKAAVYDEGVLCASTFLAIEALEHDKVALDIPVNPEGKPMFVRSMTNTDWHYSPHALDFYTGVYNSLYNRTEDGGTIEAGTDCGDAVMKFFDADDDEIVHGGYEETDEEYQERLTAGCTKTVIDFEKTNSFDVIGCTLYIEATPAQPAYMWVTVAPDIPREYGGSVPLMGRGMNLKMMGRPMYPHLFFAESCKTIAYDPDYHSGKIRIAVKHQIGQVIGIQTIFIMYEA